MTKDDKDGTKPEMLVYTVVRAGELLGLSRNSAYEAARRGDFPVIKLGKLLRVPKAALHRMIEQAAARTGSKS